MGLSIELSNIPGEEFVRDIALAWTFCNEGILIDASEPELPSYYDYITTGKEKFRKHKALLDIKACNKETVKINESLMDRGLNLLQLLNFLTHQ